MQRAVENISEKTGMPPGSFVPVGVKDGIPSKFFIYNISDKKTTVQETASLSADLLKHDNNTVLWVDVQGFSDHDSIHTLFETLCLPSLLQEDIINTRHRPKIETFEDSLLIVTKRIIAGHHKRLHSEHIVLLLGPDYILSLQPPVNDSFNGARERILNLKYPHTHKGYIFYMLLDNLIDGHFAIMEHLHQRLDRLENRLLNTKEETSPLEDLTNLKHDIAMARRIIVPMRKFVTDLRFKRDNYFLPGIDPYLSDLGDHIEQLAESCEVYSESITMLIEMNSENINIRTNEIMKTLTLISTIFMPLTFITSVYGMNFDYMPELRLQWGYPVCIIFMGIISILLYKNFKNRKWL